MGRTANNLMTLPRIADRGSQRTSNVAWVLRPRELKSWVQKHPRYKLKQKMPQCSDNSQKHEKANDNRQAAYILVQSKYVVPRAKRPITKVIHAETLSIASSIVHTWSAGGIGS
jgi:hypothetical protein